IRVVISAKNAARVLGRAVSRNGQPLPYAKVEMMHSVRYLSANGAISGGGGGRAVPRTGTDGRIHAGILQPGDRYSLTLSSPGYRTAEIAEWEAKPGETRDLGDIVLTRSDLTVRGTVKDSAGQPLLG